MNSLVATTALFQLFSIIKYNSTFDNNTPSNLETIISNNELTSEESKINEKQKTKKKKLDPAKISDWKEFKQEVLNTKEVKKLDKEKVKCIHKNQN